MTDKSKRQHRDPAFPSLFAMVYQILRRRAMELGYALTLHGSMARDLDVVAIPWTDDASSAEYLVEALCSCVDAYMSSSDDNPSYKPHGRRVWALHFTGSGTYIDLSVMPRSTCNTLP